MLDLNLRLFWSIACGVVALAVSGAAPLDLRDDWVDPDTGHRIIRLSRVPGQSYSLYFHQNGFTASSDKVVFENRTLDAPRDDRGFQAGRIYAYDFVRNQPELISDAAGKMISVAPKSRKVYHQAYDTLYATHLDTRKTETVAKLPPRWRVATINSDETLGAGSFSEGSVPADRRSFTLDGTFEAGRPRGIFILDLKTSETKVIRRGTNWFNHFQFSPTDPTLLQYCHEGPWHKVDRIWHMRADGTGVRLIHERTMPMEIAGHEFWSADGKTVWFDLQMPRSEKFFIAGVDVADGRKTRYVIDRNEWSVHFNISADGKLFAGDGGAPNMVAKASDGKWIYLFRPGGDGTVRSEKLVNMARHGYDLEPNVQFTPDARHIVFRGNFDGSAQVYAVEVAQAEKRAGNRDERFLVSDFGARGDGKTLNTKFIQSAIDACARSGGGTVVVPQGVFVSGSVFLTQGVDLEIENGGVLKGSQDSNDYPWINTRIAGLEMKWPAALVNASNVTNLKISGKGAIDGSGERWWKEYWAARAAEKDGVDPHFKIPRPRLVHIIESRQIVVRDLLLKDSAFWNLQLTYCDGVEVHDLKVRAPHAPIKAASSDGIDIDSTRNVLITGCDIECDDDAICLKAGRDADGLRVNRPTENVVIRDCRVGHAAGLVVFGSETAGGIRNVRVSNCRAEKGCGEIVRFKTRMGRGGVVEDVVYENIVADGTARVFSFNMNAFSTTWVPEEFAKPVPAELGTPVFRNITVRNLTARGCVSAGSLVGLAESPLRDITLENVDIEAKDSFTFRHLTGAKFNNVKVNGRLIGAPSDSGERINDGRADAAGN